SNGSGPDLLVVNDGSASLIYKPTPAKLTRVALANVSATLGTDAIKIIDGNGAFILTTGGMAGAFSGTVNGTFPGFKANVSIAIKTGSGLPTSAVGSGEVVGSPDVTLSGTVRVKFNTTGSARFSGAFAVDSGTVAVPTQSFSGDITLNLFGLELMGPIGFTRN